jgi:hypothetical protein
MTISPWSVDELRKHRLEYVKNQLSKDVKRLSNKQQSPIKITDSTLAGKGR